MERVVRYVDGGRRSSRAADPSYRWQGATLRPTGVVVFATLEGLGRAPSTGPDVAVHTSTHELRRRVLRSVAWLLGR